MNARLQFERVWKSGARELLDAAAQIAPLRHRLVEYAVKQARDALINDNGERLPYQVQDARAKALENLLRSVEAGIADERISPQVRRTILGSFVGNVLQGEQERMQPYRERFGEDPPTFLTISPTKKCNLRCTGCYAASSAKNDNTLDWRVLDRLLTEKSREWGSNLTVISGGEPLLYRSRGKNLFDVFERHSDGYFMMYTNGTLITERAAERMAELGNVTPAISVEGWQTETDTRRGSGVFNQVLKAMERLRRHGVPFGISVTATRHNAETILSDEFMDFFFDEQKATYGWVFQYMPIGRSYTMDLLVTPSQRKWMLEREMQLLYEKQRFLIDFWNGGPMSAGCIAAGRPGGYFYVDWDGNISPCVFFPYGIANLYEMYARGETVSDVLQCDYFRRIRRWQEAYKGNRGAGRTRNLFMPCPIRDHHAFAQRVIEQCGAAPLDEDAEAALADSEYHEGMCAYDRKLQEKLDPKWDAFLDGGRR